MEKQNNYLTTMLLICIVYILYGCCKNDGYNELINSQVALNMGDFENAYTNIIKAKHMAKTESFQSICDSVYKDIEFIQQLDKTSWLYKFNTNQFIVEDDISAFAFVKALTPVIGNKWNDYITKSDKYDDVLDVLNTKDRIFCSVNKSKIYESINCNLINSNGTLTFEFKYEINNGENNGYISKTFIYDKVNRRLINKYRVP
ncbi:MAG: hypothetical protein MJY95_01420 [Bacteroidaceae bacterium]|nr:hypothetical protein [Bacteroidaceae bacterium]